MLPYAYEVANLSKRWQKNQMNLETRIPKLQVLQVCNWIKYNQNCSVNSEKYSWIL
jgi:hypothetical protein